MVKFSLLTTFTAADAAMPGCLLERTARARSVLRQRLIQRMFVRLEDLRRVVPAMITLSGMSWPTPAAAAGAYRVTKYKKANWHPPVR